jgi:hypothetical protein
VPGSGLQQASLEFLFFLRFFSSFFLPRKLRREKGVEGEREREGGEGGRWRKKKKRCNIMGWPEETSAAVSEHMLKRR